MAEFSHDFLHRVSAGKVNGAGIIYKYGAATIDTAAYAPICFDGVYKTPITPVELEIVSTDINDTDGGSGAWTVSVDGIGADWRYQLTQVTMNGTTPVTIPDTFLRVSRIRVIDSGSYGDLSTQTCSHKGNIIVRESGGGDTWGTLAYYDGIGTGSSLIGCISVAKGFSAHILKEEIYATASKQFNLMKVIRENADRTAAPFGRCAVERLSRAETSTNIIKPKALGREINGPADILYIARATSGTVDIDLSFDIMLLNQEV